MNKNYTIINGELYHYGVPGMKWGVRNDKQETGSSSGRRSKKTESDVTENKSAQKTARKPEEVRKLIADTINRMYDEDNFEIDDAYNVFDSVPEIQEAYEKKLKPAMDDIANDINNLSFEQRQEKRAKEHLERYNENPKKYLEEEYPDYEHELNRYILEYADLKLRDEGHRDYDERYKLAEELSKDPKYQEERKEIFDSVMVNEIRTNERFSTVFSDPETEMKYSTEALLNRDENFGRKAKDTNFTDYERSYLTDYIVQKYKKEKIKHSDVHERSEKQMNKEYVIVNGELRHWGVPGMKWGHRKKQLPAIKKRDPNKTEDGADIMPEGWKPGDSTKTSNSNKTGGSASSGPSVRKNQHFDEVGAEKGSTGPKTDNKTDNKSNNKTDNKNGNKTGDKANENATNNDKKQDNLDLGKAANAAKNTGGELEKAASKIDSIAVNRPRMDLSDKTTAQLKTELDREKTEIEYNSYFSQPSKKEKAKQAVASFLRNAGTLLALGGSALVVANEYKKLKGK